MYIRIAEVNGEPVKPRISLGGAKNYIEAGEIRGDIDDDICEMFCRNGTCVEISEEEAEQMVKEAKAKASRLKATATRAEANAATAEAAAVESSVIEEDDNE